MPSSIHRTARMMILATMLGAALAACSRNTDETTRSIDEIHRDEGLPVEVRSVEPTAFRTYMSFTASVSGAAESTASSMLADEVGTILYNVGDFVERDTPVVLFPPDNPSLNWEQTRVGFESARTAFERVERLYQDDGISQQAYDDARTQFEVARANWQTVQDMARVKAPITGYITRIHVFESDNVNPGDSLFTVSDYDRLKATVWLTDRQIHRVSVGSPARAVGQDQEIAGEVVQVDLAMDESRKAFAVRLRFENPRRIIQSGVTTTIEIETYRNDQAVILRQNEVIETTAGTYVYLVRDDRAVRAPVVIDHRQGRFVEIASGLDQGQEVIVSGIELVGEGMPVRIVGRDDRIVQR